MSARIPRNEYLSFDSRNDPVVQVVRNVTTSLQILVRKGPGHDLLPYFWSSNQNHLSSFRVSPCEPSRYYYIDRRPGSVEYRLRSSPDRSFPVYIHSGPRAHSSSESEGRVRVGTGEGSQDKQEWDPVFRSTIHWSTPYRKRHLLWTFCLFSLLLLVLCDLS